MSVVSLSNASRSNLGLDDLRELANKLNISIDDDEVANDYLRLLWSFEGILNQVEDGEDYIHPALQPQAVSPSREYTRPTSEENPINAWSHCCSFRSTAPADARLQGRTLAIKDNISVGGLPTTLGAPASIASRDGVYKESPVDATIVSRLLAAGATIKGTTTCEFYCASPLSFTSATGPVHNPRLRGYTAGGSSSGSAALVAAHGLAEPNAVLGETVELSVGTDQGGSVRIPASFNGIYGLKPTHGLIPYTGAASMSPMIDHLGVFAPTVDDIAVLLEVSAGYDGIDPRMTPESPLLGSVKPYSEMLAGFRQQLAQGLDLGRKWRIGLVTESFAVPGVSPDVRDTVREAAKAFFAAAGATVVDISIPMHTEGPLIWTASTRPSMSSWLCQGKPTGHLSYLPPHFQSKWPLSKEDFDCITALNPALGNIVLSEVFAQTKAPAWIEAKADRKAFQLRAAYDKALESVDVLITPCAPTIATPNPASVDSDGAAIPILERLQPAIGVISNTCPFNVSGHPAMSVPCGSSSHPEHPDVELPIGMQIVGKRWADEDVLYAAALFETGRAIVSK
ncbi:amidase signature domain-containing protein [Stachybotrys elegans]|uniref:Amidase signature domain-containing protein n=1 Tax=Stachybotrys elegans TaxID=80388 RepID=A0A8K0SXZ8_9HYPO|nr:amidase signature domain-containing protein [Stachybotrys elegans]